MAGCDAVMVALDRFRAALDELVAVSLGGLDVGELLAVADAMQAGKFPLTSNQSGVRTADNNRLRRNTHELMRHELAQPLRTHRRRDVHRAHHVGDQHGDLLVFGMLGGRCIAEPQASQEHTPSHSSVPHVRHEGAAVSRPSAVSGP